MSFTSGAAVCSTPAIANGKVYFGSCDDKMYCLDANTGNNKWSYHAGSYEIRSSPAVAQGLVYFIDHNLDGLNGKIYCLNANSGTIVWSYMTGSPGGFSSPAVANGIVFVGAGNWFYAIGTMPQTDVPEFQLALILMTSLAIYSYLLIRGKLDRTKRKLSKSKREED